MEWLAALKKFGISGLIVALGSLGYLDLKDEITELRKDVRGLTQAILSKEKE